MRAAAHICWHSGPALLSATPNRGLHRAIQKFLSPTYDRDGFTAVEIAAAHLDEEFIVVFDDAERFGERRTIRKLEAMLRAGDRRVWRGTTRAHKWQVVLASGANSASVFV